MSSHGVGEDSLSHRRIGVQGQVAPGSISKEGVKRVPSLSTLSRVSSLGVMPGGVCSLAQAVWPGPKSRGTAELLQGEVAVLKKWDLRTLQLGGSGGNRHHCRAKLVT